MSDNVENNNVHVYYREEKKNKCSNVRWSPYAIR